MSPVDPPSVLPGRSRLVNGLLVACVAAAVGAWLWRNLCLFPAYGWNEVRLAPVFQWWHDGTPYPALATGPTTTWLYGPLPLAIMLPVVAAGTTAGALLAAAMVNLVAVAVAAAVVVLAWPSAQPGESRTGRGWAALVAICLWPGGAYRFFTADNIGIAFGLLSLLCLARSERPGRSLPAAVGCVAALLCKQTFIGLAAAQLVWLAVRHGLPASRQYALRLAGLAAGALAGFAVCWGIDAPVFHLLVLPFRQPWVSAPLERLTDFRLDLFVQLAIPAALLAWSGRRLWRRDSPWLLPALVWAISWPLDAAAFLKHGGSANSLHAGLLFLPIAGVLLLPALPPRRRSTLLAALALAVAGWSLARVSPGVWRPQTEHLRQGDALARELPGEVYFPWHPLISWYAEQRIDEVEDGLFIRACAGLPVPVTQARLPPRFHVVAFRRDEMDWGIARTLIPRNARADSFGLWELHSWPLHR